MRRIASSSAFEKDVKRLRRRGKDIEKLKSAIRTLAAGDRLDAIYRDHRLTGKLDGYRDCHIESDWVLVYALSDTELRLVRTGSHADLFK